MFRCCATDNRENLESETKLCNVYMHADRDKEQPYYECMYNEKKTTEKRDGSITYMRRVYIQCRGFSRIGRGIWQSRDYTSGKTRDKIVKERQEKRKKKKLYKESEIQKSPL